MNLRGSANLCHLFTLFFGNNWVHTDCSPDALQIFLLGLNIQLLQRCAQAPQLGGDQRMDVVHPGVLQTRQVHQADAPLDVVVKHLAGHSAAFRSRETLSGGTQGTQEEFIWFL